MPTRTHTAERVLVWCVFMHVLCGMSVCVCVYSELGVFTMCSHWTRPPIQQTCMHTYERHVSRAWITYSRTRRKQNDDDDRDGLTQHNKHNTDTSSTNTCEFLLHTLTATKCCRTCSLCCLSCGRFFDDQCNRQCNFFNALCGETNAVANKCSRTQTYRQSVGHCLADRNCGSQRFEWYLLQSK